jgi:hypothetical protein
MMFIAYCVSNIIAPQFFKPSQSPLYPLGFGAILGSYILSLITIAIYMLLCFWENNRRDARDAASGATVHPDTDFKDLTDKQNLVCIPVLSAFLKLIGQQHFRYVW